MHNILDRLASEVSSSCSTVTKRVRYERNMTDAEHIGDSVNKLSEAHRRDVEDAIGGLRIDSSRSHPELENDRHCWIVNRHPLLQAGLGDSESKSHRAMAAPQTRIVRHDDVTPGESGHLANVQEAAEGEEEGDSGRMKSTLRHCDRDENAELPRQRRV